MEYVWQPGLGFEFELPGHGQYQEDAPPVNIPRTADPTVEGWLARTFHELLELRSGPNPVIAQAALVRYTGTAGVRSSNGPSWRGVWNLMLQTYGEEFLSKLEYPITYSSHMASRYISPLRMVERPVDPVMVVLLAGALSGDVRWYEDGALHSSTTVTTPAPDTAALPTERSDQALEHALEEAGYVLNRAGVALGLSRHQLIQRIISAGLTCPIVTSSNSKYDAEALENMIRALRGGASIRAVQQTYGGNLSLYDQLAIYDPELRLIMKRHRQDRTRQANRQRFLDSIRTNPCITRTEIRNHLPGPASFLARNDKAWLDAQLASLSKATTARPGPSAGRNRRDDTELDAEIETKLRKVMPALRALQPPRRLTPTLALRLAEIPLAVFGKVNAGRMPRTQAVFDEFKEPLRSFVTRRLEYAIHRLMEERCTLTLVAIRLASGLTERVIESHRDVVQQIAQRDGLSFSPRAATKLTTPLPAARIE
jgi:hypothetical protein